MLAINSKMAAFNESDIVEPQDNPALNNTLDISEESNQTWTTSRLRDGGR